MDALIVDSRILRHELFGDLGGDIVDRGCKARLADCISAQHVCDGDGHPTL
jgi:hypothetical protein